MKRGQAALEFLTTYGWAFLVILVMIGALSYFGVLDPQSFLPNRCTLEAGLNCGRFVLDSSPDPHQARFEITNNLGKTISIQSIHADVDSSGGSYSLVCSDPGEGFTSGETFDVTCDLGEVGDEFLNLNTKDKVYIKIVYSEGSSWAPTYAINAFGEIYSKVI